jgi:hypothetical protein
MSISQIILISFPTSTIFSQNSLAAIYITGVPCRKFVISSSAFDIYFFVSRYFLVVIQFYLKTFKIQLGRRQIHIYVALKFPTIYRNLFLVDKKNCCIFLPELFISRSF